MLRPIFKSLVLIGLLSCFGLAREPLTRAQIKAFGKDIAAGNRILEAGRTGDQRLVPHLQMRLGILPNDSVLRADVIRALARLGDKSALAEVDAKLESKDPFDWVAAANVDLPYIGGWFAISRLTKLLDADAEFNRLPRREEPEDAIDEVLINGSPRQWALEQLEQVVSHPPIKYSRGQSQEQDAKAAEIWKNYIHANADRLRKLKPQPS